MGLDCFGSQPVFDDLVTGRKRFCLGGKAEKRDGRGWNDDDVDDGGDQTHRSPYTSSLHLRSCGGELVRSTLFCFLKVG